MLEGCVSLFLSVDSAAQKVVNCLFYMPFRINCALKECCPFIIHTTRIQNLVTRTVKSQFS